MSDPEEKKTEAEESKERRRRYYDAHYARLVDRELLTYVHIARDQPRDVPISQLAGEWIEVDYLDHDTVSLRIWDRDRVPRFLSFTRNGLRGLYARGNIDNFRFHRPAPLEAEVDHSLGHWDERHSPRPDDPRLGPPRPPSMRRGHKKDPRKGLGRPRPRRRG